MTHIFPWTRTVTMAVALAFVATVASPQSAKPGAVTSGDHAHGAFVPPSASDQSLAARHKGMLGKMATEQARLKMLVADMNMLTGDLKVEAIARLLTLLVERHSDMRADMMEMHERMMGRPTEGMPDDAAEEEPGAMCSPTAN